LELKLNRLYRSCEAKGLPLRFNGQRAAIRCSRTFYPLGDAISEGTYCRIWAVDRDLCGPQFSSRPELVEFELASAKTKAVAELKDVELGQGRSLIMPRRGWYDIKVRYAEEYRWDQRLNEELLQELINKGYVSEVPAASPPRELEELLDLEAIDARAAEGMMIGGAVGDALGYPAESMSHEERARKYGYIEGFISNERTRGARGVVSDDTQMSFDTLIVLLANGYLDLEDLASIFSSHRLFGIGGTVKVFLRNYKEKGMPWYLSGIKSLGNGAIMRVHPLLIAHARGINDNLSGLFADAVLATIMTHRGPLQVGLSLAFLTFITRMARPVKVDPEEELGAFSKVMRAVAGPAPVQTKRASRVPFDPGNTADEYIVNAVEWGLEHNVKVEHMASERLAGSGGHVLETVPLALFISLKYADDPLRAVLEAANKTHDNDSIASMVGAVMGARHGVKPFLGLASRLCGCLRERDQGTIQRLVRETVCFVNRRGNARHHR
jgi:ADP-ribosylglycohydrolase